jgi:hypothetical protein
MVLVVMSCKGDVMPFHIFSKKLKNITKDNILSFLKLQPFALSQYKKS